MGEGVQVAPGMLGVSPGVPPVQLMVTFALPMAGLGDVVQVGTTGAVNCTVTGDPLMSLESDLAVTE